MEINLLNAAALTAAVVVGEKMLAQMEPNKITAISPATEKTDTWFFRTREGGHGILQIVGEGGDPRGVKIRYKLVQQAGGGAGTGAGGGGGVAPRKRADAETKAA